MAILYMLIGLPAAGKSTYARKMADQFGNVEVVSSDAIREMLYGDGGFTKSEQAVVFEQVHKEVIGLLKNNWDVIYDATNLIRKYRIEFLRKLEGIDCQKRAILFMNTVENLRVINAKREKPVPDDIYNRMLRLFDPPAHYEGFDYIDIRWPEGHYSLFPYDDPGILKFIDHENHHHRLSIGDHMEKANEVFREIWGSSHLSAREAVKYHDIGKPFVKTFANYKGEKTDEAHYYQHENVGSYLYLLIAHEQLHRTNSEALYISQLINWHMRPINIWRKSPKAMQKDRLLIGTEMFGDLIRMYVADVLSEEECNE